MRSTVRPALFIGLLVGLSACGADMDTRLGGDGEACLGDRDCRSGLFCQAEACVGTPNTSGSGSKDPPPPMETCDMICAQLESCDVNTAMGTELCLETCTEQIRAWELERRVAFLDCLGERAVCDLDDLGRCVDMSAPDVPLPTDPAEGYRFVLLEDLTASPSGTSPGADIDAISVLVDGVEHFARSVEDFQLGGPDNAHANVTRLLGPAQTTCMTTDHVSLGGGFVIVGFTDAAHNVVMGSGDRITVYELGPRSCPEQSTWMDDPVRVAVSIATRRSTFLEVGVSDSRTNIVTIP